MQDLTEVQLNRHQLQMLAMIGTQQAEDPDGQWPMWQWLEHRAKSFGMERPQGVLDSLPRVGATGSLGLSYGFTTAVPNILAPDTRIALTVAAAWALEEARYDLGDPFLQVLRHMIALWRTAPRLPNKVTRVSLTSEELHEALPHVRARTIRMIPEYFSHEPLLHHSYSKQEDGNWVMDVPQDVMRYENTTNLFSYVKEACEQVDMVLREADGGAFADRLSTFAQDLDPVLHVSVSRTNLLTWLWHRKQRQDPAGPMPILLDMLSHDSFAVDQGVRFTEDEIDRASEHLEHHGLIKGAGVVDQMAGPVFAEITPAGEDCVENYNGDISAYIRRKDNGPVTFHITNNSGNIAANSTGFTQNAVTQAAFDPAQILAAATLIQQLAPALTQDPDEQQSLLAQVNDLQSAAEAPEADRGVVRRIADGVMSTIRGLAHSPDVQRLALEAVEQGIQGL